jgi:hypothetical protein
MTTALRVSLGLLALPLALAACGSEPAPAPTPVVINTPPPITAAVPSTPAQSALVMQCRDLFAQTIGGAPVDYGSPAVVSAGGSTTIDLVAQPVTPTPSPPMQYHCRYNGTTLTAAGRS